MGKGKGSKKIKNRGQSNRKGRKDKSFLRWAIDLVYREKVLTVLALLALVVVFFNVYVSIFDQKIDLNGDNLNYYYLAKNLSEKGTYAFSYDLQQRPHSHWPPGYPFIMTAFMTISDSVNFMKGVNGMFLLASSILLFLTFRRFGLGVMVSFAGAFVVLYSGPFLRYSTIMMSEIPFLFFSTLSIYLISISDFKKVVYKNHTFILAIVCLYFTYLIRSQGIALLPGIILFLLLSKKWWYIPGTFAIFGISAIPWALRNHFADVSSSYVNQLLMKNPYRVEDGQVDFMGLLERILSNAQRYLDKEIPVSLVNNLSVVYTGDNFEKWTHWWVGTILVVLITIGIFAIQKNRSLLIGYIAGTLGILLLWPEVWFGNRFILPIIPFLAVSAINGIKFLADLIIQKAIGWNFQFNALLLIPVIVMLNIDRINQLRQNASHDIYPPAYANYFEVATWARENIEDENTVIAARKPELFHHFSGTYMARFRRTPDEEALIEGLKRNEVTHVVIEQLGFADTGRYLLPAVQNNPGIFQVIHQTEEPQAYLITFNPQ